MPPWIARQSLLLAALACGLARAESTPDTYFDLSLDELLQLPVSVSSRSELPLRRTPAVVTLFTAADIRRMGARDLRDVLRRVPGFELGMRSFGYAEFGLRGVSTDNSEKVLILLDGMPVNEHLEGSGTIVFGDLPLENIRQVEVIRGPGSALYGNNAFVGVISLISKRATPGEWQADVRADDLDGREASLRGGWQFGAWQATAYLNFLDTDGSREPVAQDALQIRGSPPWFADLNRGVSLAGTDAGYTDNRRRRWLAQLHLDNGGWYFDALALDAHKGSYVGTLFTINREADAHPSQSQASLGYRWQVNPKWQIEPRLYWRRYVADNLWNSFPPGYRVPDGQGDSITYSRGQFDRNGATQQTRGGELKSTWNGDAHTLIAGLSFERQALYDHVNQTNVPGFGAERMIDLPPIIASEPVRRLASAYLQDQWQLTPELTLTTGLRQDRYNDAGESLTPRVAAVWTPNARLTLKALYGEAFRAPTFVESYLWVFDGFVRGNIDNQPETIRTRELAAIVRINPNLLWQANLYRSRVGNLLRLMPDAGGSLEYRNVADTTRIDGWESELQFELGDAVEGFLNYARHRSEVEPTGEPLVGMARWQANGGVHYSPNARLRLSALLHAVGPRARASSDPRPTLKGYRSIDLALGYALRPGLELSLGVYNLADADQRFPDPSAGLPGDFPWEGRTVSVRLSWSR